MDFKIYNADLNKNVSKNWHLKSKTVVLDMRFEILYTSSDLSTNVQREMTKYQVLIKTRAHTGRFVFHFLVSSPSLQISS